MAMQLIIIQMAGGDFLVFYSNIFLYYNMGAIKLLVHSGADLGFTEKRTILSIESLK